MYRRQRWTPVKGTSSRIRDPGERLAVSSFDMASRVLVRLSHGLGLDRPAPVPPPAAWRDVLVLRLDRIGDVLMCAPALAELREAAPRARIRLAVGGWSEPLARSLPVDEVLVWSAPFSGRPGEPALSWAELWAQARPLRREPIDLGLDLQGDPRAALLLWAAGAKARVGYANAGGGHLLTKLVPLDETLSWVEQNRRAVAVATGRDPGPGPRPLDPLTAEDHAFAEAFLGGRGLLARRPLVGLHPSGGRRVKQWDLGRWRELARRLGEEFKATVLVTGSVSDRPLFAEVAHGLVPAPLDLTGQLDLRQTLAVLARLDLFLSSDTGPMHLACAAGTPSVSLFGPSDPVRYFSGGALDGHPERHLVVRSELWCAPCNRIRRPPRECDGGEPPECLALLSVERVHGAAASLLRAGGGFPRRGGAR